MCIRDSTGVVSSVRPSFGHSEEENRDTNGEEYWGERIVWSTMAPVVWTPWLRSMIVMVVIAAQWLTSSWSSGTIKRLNHFPTRPGSLAMCSFASFNTGRLCQSKDGVGGGEEVIHSNDHPPHGSAGALSPLTKLSSIFATKMKFEKKNKNAPVSYTHLRAHET